MSRMFLVQTTSLITIRSVGFEHFSQTLVLFKGSAFCIASIAHLLSVLIITLLLLEEIRTASRIALSSGLVEEN